MKIWYQLLSSEEKMKHFLARVKQNVDRAVGPETNIEVHGTREGVLGDQYRMFFQYDLREVLEGGMKVREEGGYDAFVVANSLDPAIVDLREMLNIPVLSFMEVNCFVACMMGEKFCVITPNRKMVPRYREIVYGYGLIDRLACLEPIGFTDVRSQEDAFVDDAVAESVEAEMIAATRRAAEKGAEVVFAAGPPGALLASRGIFEVDGIPILDTYTLLAKYAEAAVTMHRLTGVCVSRQCLYASPPKELVKKMGETYGIDALKNG